MVANYPWKACLLTTILLFGATGAQAEPSNPEDGTDGADGENAQTPCNIILIGTQRPYVDVHPECIGSWP